MSGDAAPTLRIEPAINTRQCRKGRSLGARDLNRLGRDLSGLGVLATRSVERDLGAVRAADGRVLCILRVVQAVPGNLSVGHAHCEGPTDEPGLGCWTCAGVLVRR